MKRLIDNIARYILTVSGFTTSVVILLIIGFLFQLERSGRKGYAHHRIPLGRP